MKKLLIAFLASFGLTAMAQNTVISTSPAEATLMYNGATVRNPAKARLDITHFVYIAQMAGYSTQGVSVEELKDKNEANYTIKLDKLSPLPATYKSKKIYVAGFVDRSGHAGNYYSADNLLNDPSFLNKLNEDLKKFGYLTTIKSSVFEEKTDNSDYKIAGEITAFSNDTRGSGFQMSLVMKWSVYDISEGKVVQELITGGFVNTTDANWTNGVNGAVKNAMVGLMNNATFQKLVNKNEVSSTKGDSTAIVFPVVKISKPESISALSKLSLASVVTIKVNEGHGSGFIISSDGYILTNQHVVGSADRVTVLFNNGFEFEAEVIRQKHIRDVALIKIKGKGFTPLSIKDASEDLLPGTEVIAIGTPKLQELNQSVTKGIISGKRTIDKNTYLQTDVAVNGGNSGGPLIDVETGKVVGIVVGKLNASGVEGINFGIPIEDALKALNISFE